MDILKTRKFVANRIYELRTKKDLSARKLSLLLGMSPGYINKIENCKSMPSLELLFIICIYFNITPKEFFEEMSK